MLNSPSAQSSLNKLKRAIGNGARPLLPRILLQSDHYSLSFLLTDLDSRPNQTTSMVSGAPSSIQFLSHEIIPFNERNNGTDERDTMNVGDAELID